MSTIKYVHRIIDSVWTLEVEQVVDRCQPKGSVRVLHYSRDDADGYKHEFELPHGRPIEDGDRNIVGVQLLAESPGRHRPHKLAGELHVVNPGHIFSFPLVTEVNEVPTPAATTFAQCQNQGGANDAVQAALADNAANAGREFYRKPYDLAQHVLRHLDEAGFKIVRKPVRKAK